MVTLRTYQAEDLQQMTSIWNEVVEEGGSFPFEDKWTPEQLASFLAGKTVHCAIDEDRVAGFYLLHENIFGRCSSGANATYLVRADLRGKHIGEMLVKDSIRQAKAQGFRYMQFNGVVDTNIHARHLYQRCGFKEVGVIPKGFRIKDGSYQDMHIMYLNLESSETAVGIDPETIL